MKRLDEIGNVITCDVLVVGGGMAGIPAALQTRENGADVLVVEKAWAGLAGQAPRGGNGFMTLKPGADLDHYVKVVTETIGMYLNDQIGLRYFAEHINYTIEQLDKWGASFRKKENGELVHWEQPTGAWQMNTLNLYALKDMRKTAVKNGVRFMDFTHITDLIKNKDRVVGAVGYNIHDGEFYIFIAKTVILAGGGCAYKAARMFYGSGETVSMAFRAGAQTRNGEFVFLDIASAETGETIHGCQRVVCNKYGELIWDKYVTYTAADVTGELLYGCIKEIKDGNGPLYIDMEKLPEEYKVLAVTDEIDGYKRFFPDKESWTARKEAREAEVFGGQGVRIPAQFKFDGNNGPIKVTKDFATTVPGLYATGADANGGSAFFGAAPLPAGQRGLPFTFCPTSGILAANAACAEAKAMDGWADIDPEAVAMQKSKTFKYLGKDGINPREFIDRIMDAVLPADVIFYRSEETLTGAMEEVNEIRKDFDKMGAKDLHEMKLCIEAETMTDVAEIMIRSALARKESRGFHFREDYPEENNAEYLKWVCLDYHDGDVKTTLEDIPINQYPNIPSARAVKKAKNI